MVFHLRPGELQLSQPDQPDRTYVYRDSPALRAVVGQGLTALLAAHQNTVFGHECGRCGNSCRRREILVREQEILGLQQRLGLSEVEFRERYLDPADATWNPGDAFLRLVDGACPFLEPGHPAIPHSASCRVYEVRPQVCRSFRSDASFCRKDPERLLEQVTAVEVFEHETQLTLASGSTHQVPTDPEWWMGLRAQVELSEQSDPAKYAGVLGKALAILADLEAEVVWEGHRDTLLALAELLTSAAELGHLQPSLNEQLENGWVRVQTLLARLDQPPKREPEQPVASRPEGVEWIHLVEAGLTLQTRERLRGSWSFAFIPDYGSWPGIWCRACSPGPRTVCSNPSRSQSRSARCVASVAGCTPWRSCPATSIGSALFSSSLPRSSCIPTPARPASTGTPAAACC